MLTIPEIPHWTMNLAVCTVALTIVCWYGNRKVKEEKQRIEKRVTENIRQAVRERAAVLLLQEYPCFCCGGPVKNEVH